MTEEPLRMLDLLVVVDDLATGREAAETVARRAGMDFRAFEHPREALPALLEEARPFVLVLDHNFEDAEVFGYHLCNDLREQHPYGLLLPIVYLSGYMNGEQFLDLLKDKLAYAPTAFLSKGDAKELLPLVRRIAETYGRLHTVAQTQAANQALAALAGMPE